MNNAVIDFESYYDKEISVTTQGLPNYVRATDAYLVSVCTDDFEFCGTMAELGRSVNVDELARSARPVAANANFDQALWAKYFPPFKLPWHCVLDHAASHQYPTNVAGVSKALLGLKVDKSTRDEMKGVHYEALPDARKQEVIDYCMNDALVEKQILNTLPPMDAFEEKVALHTRMINRRGVYIDLAKVERDKQYLERIHFDAWQRIPWTDKDEDLGRPPLSAQAFAEYCQGKGVVAPASLDKSDVDTNAWLKQHPELAIVVDDMRAYRTSNTLLEKLKSLERIADGDKLPLEILYCGARHTRRWSSKGFNVQNLTRDPMFNRIMREWPEFVNVDDRTKNSEGKTPRDLVGIFFREYLIPPPGMKWGIIDLAQIEPRCLNWLIGNEVLLAKIRLGYSVYEAYAATYEGWNGKPGTLKKEYGIVRYTLLKNTVLGLGYGMGESRFAEYAKVDAEEATRVVRGYRAGNAGIVGFWRQFDQSIAQAVLSKDRELAIQMPTGDYLRHFNVRQKLVQVEVTDKETGLKHTKFRQAQESYTIRGDFSQASHQPRCWGGTLTENVTQRMARDVLAEAVLRLEDAGFPVYFHAHDEVILGLPEATAERDLKEAERLMLISPDWCPDLPLGVEGKVAAHYEK
jgi:DNA polymerase